jgi:RNA polymerase sigma-70 factor (ECF subfamily)
MSPSPSDPVLTETISLLRLAKNGDPDAVNDLYARYGHRLETVVRLRLGRRLRAKMETCDIVQDALLAALPHIETTEFESNGSFFHWLTSLVENRIRDMADHFGAQKRDAGRERPLEATAAQGDSTFGPISELATFGTPSQVLSRKEEIEKLEQAVDALPDDQREALLLVRFEGLSLAEAGAAMSRSPDAVRMLVSRAIVKLGQLLGEAERTA